MAEKDFKGAVKYLSKRFSRVEWELRARKSLILIRYERGEREELENEIRALVLYLGRKEGIHPKVIRSFQNDLKLINKLIKIFKSKDLLSLKAEVENTKSLSDRKWFLEKIEEKMKSQKTSVLD